LHNGFPILKYFLEFSDQWLPIFCSDDSHLWESYVTPGGRATLNCGHRSSASKKLARSSASESSHQALFLS